MIKTETINSLKRYEQYGIPPGGFLQAVLANDLIGAAFCADEDNFGALAEIALYCFSNLTISSRSSHEKVDAWIVKRLKEQIQGELK